MSATGARRIATDRQIERGTGLYIPLSGTAPGGEYGTPISHVDREYAILRTPVGHRLVFTLAHDIWDKWFEVELEGEHDEKENQAFNDKIQKELLRLKAKKELNRMTIFERGFGWSIIAISYEGTKDHAEPYPGEGQTFQNIVDIRAYGASDITSTQDDKDPSSKRYGFPLEYRVEQSGITKRLRLHYSRVIHVATRLLKHDWQGVSILDSLWDDLVTLQNIRWSMGQTMYRYGSGFPDLEFSGAEKAQLEAWQASEGISNLFSRAYFLHNEKQKLDFKGIGGVALDPMNYYLPILESISLASSVPLAILRGVQAGALTGSEVNEREYQGMLSDEQSMYEDALIELITAILRQPNMQAPPKEGKAADAEPTIPAFKIKWLSGIELSPIEEIDLELKKAQVLQIKGGWHTRNELREMEDPNADPLPADQGGDEILGRVKIPQGSETFHVKENEDGSHTVTDLGASGKKRSSS